MVHSCEIETSDVVFALQCFDKTVGKPSLKVFDKAGVQKYQTTSFNAVRAVEASESIGGGISFTESSPNDGKSRIKVVTRSGIIVTTDPVPTHSFRLTDDLDI